RHRRHDPGHPARRARGAPAAPRPGHPVRGRRHGHRDRYREGLTTHPRAARSARHPPERGQHQRPGKAGSAVLLGQQPQRTLVKTIRYELHDGIATLTFDEPDSPVNTMCADWQRDLSTVTGLVVRDKALIKGLILASAKSSFFAGADLKATMRLRPEDARQVYAEI